MKLRWEYLAVYCYNDSDDNNYDDDDDEDNDDDDDPNDQLARTMAQHGRLKSLYISQPSFAIKTTGNHQDWRGLRTETPTANYLNFHLELNAARIRCIEVEV